MSIQPGADHSWTRPIDPHEDEVLGCHRGVSEGLNIRNPQPGFHYYYIRAEPNMARRYINMGYEVVTSEYPEQPGIKALPQAVQSMMDGERAFKDVMLVRIPVEIYREHQAEKRRRAEASLRSASDAFQAKGERAAEALGRGAGKHENVYYQTRDHGSSVEEF